MLNNLVRKFARVVKLKERRLPSVFWQFMEMFINIQLFSNNRLCVQTMRIPSIVIVIDNIHWICFFVLLFHFFDPVVLLAQYRIVVKQKLLPDAKSLLASLTGETLDMISVLPCSHDQLKGCDGLAADGTDTLFAK